MLCGDMYCIGYLVCDDLSSLINSISLLYFWAGAPSFAELDSSCSVENWCKDGICPEGTTCFGSPTCNIQELIRAGMEAEKGESGGVDEGSDTKAGEEDADEDEDEESKHFFCGLDWGAVSNNCDGSQPCPTGTNEECVMLGAQCFGGTTCDSSKGDGEYFEFFGLLYEDARNRLFCGYISCTVTTTLFDIRADLCD